MIEQEEAIKMAEKKNKETITTDSVYGEASAATLKEALSACYEARQPIVIVGDPGMGKTALVNSWYKSHNLGEMVTLIGSQMEPTDLTGLPMAGTMRVDGHDVSVTEYGMPYWQAKLLNGESKCVFLDEFSNTPASVQAAMLKFIGERVFGNGEKLPDDVLIVLAMNPEDTAVDYNPISAPMANRLLWISYRPSDEEVVKGLRGASDWFTKEEMDAWSDEEVKWRERISDFLKGHTAYIADMTSYDSAAADSTSAAYDIENCPSEREIVNSVWASPRSWDNAARVLSRTGYYNKINTFQERLLRGIVGVKSATKLVEFAEKNSRIDPYELIRNPEKQNWRVSSENANAYDEILAIANSVNAAAVKCDGKNGRPNVVEVIEFYSKVLDLGGGAHFMPALTGSGEVNKFLRNSNPDGISQKDYRKLWTGLLVKYTNADLIPNQLKKNK